MTPILACVHTQGIQVTRAYLESVLCLSLRIVGLIGCSCGFAVEIPTTVSR
jgi:hypothetical protein